MAANAHSQAQRLRLEVEELATAVNAQQKLRRCCFQLMIRDYGPGSKSQTVTLRRLAGALNAIRSNPEARRISMTKVRAIMREYKYFTEDQPDQGQNVAGLVPLNAIIRYYVRDPQTSRLYGYEVGSISKAWHLVKLDRRYIVDSEVLDAAQFVANNERHMNIKQWLQSVQESSSGDPSSTIKRIRTIVYGHMSCICYKVLIGVHMKNCLTFSTLQSSSLRLCQDRMTELTPTFSHFANVPFVIVNANTFPVCSRITCSISYRYF